MKSKNRIIISGIIQFIIFLVILAVGNALIPQVNNSIYSSSIKFLNSSIFILLVIAFIGIINELFWNSYLPFSLLAPIISSVLGVYIVKFIYSFWNFLNSYINLNIQIPLGTIYILVIVGSLAGGYFLILLRAGKPEKEKSEKEEEEQEEDIEEKKDEGKKSIGWHEIGSQFKLLFFNIGKSINSLFMRDKIKEKGKRDKRFNKKRG